MDKTKDPQNASLKFLHDEIKSHVSIVPGAGHILDTVFDSLDEVSELHSEEANELVAGTAEELRNAMKVNFHTLDTSSFFPFSALFLANPICRMNPST